jgi:hypothetical protein
MDQQAPAPFWKERAVQQYVTVCVAALAAILLVLLQRRYGIWALLPVLAGLLGGPTRFGPLVLLVALALCLNAPMFYGAEFASRPSLAVADVILAGAALAYAAAHYRLQGLIVEIFPADPRRRREPPRRSGWLSLWKSKGRLIRQQRSASVATQQEIPQLAVTALACVSVAQIGWLLLPADSGNPGLVRQVWQAILLAWLIGLTWLIVGSILDYVQRRSMTAAEAELFLQDALWAETRREQRRINRWLAWVRMRQQRREGAS